MQSSVGERIKMVDSRKSESFFTFSYSFFLCFTLFSTFSPPCGLGFSQNGGWSPWSKLQTPCQINKDTEDLVECGGGVRVRYRSCSMPVPQGPLGQPCQGDDFKYEWVVHRIQQLILNPFANLENIFRGL